MCADGISGILCEHIIAIWLIAGKFFCILLSLKKKRTAKSTRKIGIADFSGAFGRSLFLEAGAILPQSRLLMGFVISGGYDMIDARGRLRLSVCHIH